MRNPITHFLVTTVPTLILAICLYLIVFPLHAAHKQPDILFECDGYRVTWSQANTNYPVVMSILREPGVWTELPESTNERRMVFFNLDTQEVAEMGIEESNQIYLVLAANTQKFNAGEMTHRLRCRFK